MKRYVKKFEEEALESSRKMQPYLIDILDTFAGQYGDPRFEVKQALDFIMSDIELALDGLPRTDDKQGQLAYIKEFKHTLNKKVLKIN